MELRDYQLAAGEWLADHQTGLLADEMGLGKSVELIVGARLSKRQRIVIVAPAVACGHWRNEVRKWTDWGVTRLEGTKQLNQLNRLISQYSLFEGPLVVILNYEVLHIYEMALANWADLIVFDESHYLKNPGGFKRDGGVKGTKRTAVATRLAGNIRRRDGFVWLASGTPMPSKPIELFSQLVIMGYEHLVGGWQGYITAYCEGRLEWITVKGGFRKRVWKYDGASNLGALRKLLESECMIRRKRSEVMPDIEVMPPNVVYVDFDEKIQEEYEKAAADIGRFMWDKVYNRMVAEGHENPTQMAMEAMLRAEAGGHLVELSSLRSIIGRGKLRSIYAWIDEWLEANPTSQLVVFAHHREIVEAIYSKYDKRCSRIIGGMDHTDRDSEINKFKEGRTSIACCSTQAAGIGIDFSNAHDIVFCEFEWTSAAHRQATDRCARHGQKDVISVTYLAVPESIDADMAEHIAAQMVIVDQVFSEGQDVAVAALRRLVTHGS